MQRDDQTEYDKQFPGKILFAGAATGMYRSLKLWELAVREAGNLDREHVAAALDHTKVSEGPSGPAQRWAQRGFSPRYFR